MIVPQMALQAWKRYHAHIIKIFKNNNIQQSHNTQPDIMKIHYNQDNTYNPGYRALLLSNDGGEGSQKKALKLKLPPSESYKTR